MLLFQGITGAEERMGLVWSKAVEGEKMEPTRFVEVIVVMVMMVIITMLTWRTWRRSIVVMATEMMSGVTITMIGCRITHS